MTMATLTGGKRKMSPALEGSGNGGAGAVAPSLQRQRLADKLRLIQGQVATLQRMATPPPSPPALAAENENVSAGAVVEDKTEAPDASGGTAAYTDFSAVPEPCTLEDVLKTNVESAPSEERREMNEASIRRRGGGKDGGDGGGGKGKGRRGPSTHATFPAKLHDILSRPDMSGVITWLDHGRSWRIVDQSAFIGRVMPAYFSQSKIASFMRQVNGWGFVRIMRGDDANSYYSEFFLRGKRSLVRFMERKPAVRDMLGPEPNFAEYEKMPPSPEVDPTSLVPLPPAPPEPSALSSTKGERVGELVPLNAWGISADQWALQQLSMQQQAQLLSGLHKQQQQPPPSQMFLTQQPPQNMPSQETVLCGQLVQQRQASLPQAFLHEALTRVPGDMTMASIVVPDTQGSMQTTLDGFQNPTQQEQFALQNGANPVQQEQFALQNGAAPVQNEQFALQNGAALGTPGSTISPSPQLSQGAFPHDVTKMPQNATELMALMQSGKNPALQQIFRKQQSQQQQALNPHQQDALLPHLQETLNYELMDPTPLPEGKALQVVTPPAQQSHQGFLEVANDAAAKFTTIIDPLDIGETAGGGMGAEMDDVDITGMMPPLTATTSATGEEDFMGVSLDDIW